MTKPIDYRCQFCGKTSPRKEAYRPPIRDRRSQWVRRLFRQGGSQAVTLPAYWSELMEREGGPFGQVVIEARGDSLVIRPLREGAARVAVVEKGEGDAG